jgi:hypothetical protein
MTLVVPLSLLVVVLALWAWPRWNAIRKRDIPPTGPDA